MKTEDRGIEAAAGNINRRNRETEQQQEYKEKGRTRGHSSSREYKEKRRTRGQTAAGNIKRRGELEDRQQQGI